MKAIRATQAGDPSVLKIEDIPQPKPGPGEALVAVRITGVNFADIYYRSGSARVPTPFPFTPGIEGAGVVEAVGEGVSEVKAGDRIGIIRRRPRLVPRGSKSSKPPQLAPLPGEMSFKCGTAVILQGITAALFAARVLSDGAGARQCWCIPAAGGMGLLLVQWLKHMGAVAIGTVSTEAKAKIAREAGAEHVINYTTQDFADEAKKLPAAKA